MENEELTKVELIEKSDIKKVLNYFIYFLFVALIIGSLLFYILNIIPTDKIKYLFFSYFPVIITQFIWAMYDKKILYNIIFNSLTMGYMGFILIGGFLSIGILLGELGAIVLFLSIVIIGIYQAYKAATDEVIYENKVKKYIGVFITVVIMTGLPMLIMDALTIIPMVLASMITSIFLTIIYYDIYKLKNEPKVHPERFSGFILLFTFGISMGVFIMTIIEKFQIKR